MDFFFLNFFFSLLFSNPYNFLRSIKVPGVGKSNDTRSKAATEDKLLNHSLLQQNEFTHQMMSKILKELKKTRTSSGHKLHKVGISPRQTQKRRHHKSSPKRPNHGNGCKCPKCIRWRSYHKGKGIPGKYSKFVMPQFDGNISDSDYEPEHRSGRMASGTNDMALQEGPSTSAQSQLPLQQASAAREGGNSRLSGRNQPSKQGYKSSVNHHSFARNFYNTKRPAKLAAKNMLKEVFDFFENARNIAGDTTDSEDLSQSDYNLGTPEESSNGDSDEDEDYEDEEFHSAQSPTAVLEGTAPKPCKYYRRSTKPYTKHLESPANESDSPIFNEQESGDDKEPRGNTHSIGADPDETKICHVESFDLELNSTRLDQFNIPATFQQAPEHYLRFLSKC